MFTTLPVLAGAYEDAFKKNDKVFLYFYTQRCGYCVKFNPIYKRLQNEYSGKYEFLKLDAMSQYGYKWFRKYKCQYVPYVLLLDSKKRRAYTIDPTCLMQSACVREKMDEFLK